MNLDLIFQRQLLKVFFPKMKGKPKQEWINEAKALGSLNHFRIPRGSGNLSILEIVPPNALNRYVICVHAITRRGKFFFVKDQARVQTYLDKGFRLITFDFNSFGESDYIDAFLWRDVASVIDYIKENRHPEALHLHATSLGCSHTIRALSHLPKNSSAILENPARELMDYWEKFPVTRAALKFLYLLNPRFIQESDYPDAFARLDRKDLFVLFIVCEKDSINPPALSRDLFERGNIPKELVTFRDADHFKAPQSDWNLYKKCIDQCLNWTLNRTPRSI